MMLHGELLGKHLPNDGKGITGEDLYQLLKSIPAKARNNYLKLDSYTIDAEITGIGISQSDQAEKWELKLFILTDEDSKEIQSRTPEVEPHKLIRPVWYEGKIHDVIMNKETSPILARIRHYISPHENSVSPEVSVFPVVSNPDDWAALLPHVVPERPKNLPRL